MGILVGYLETMSCIDLNSFYTCSGSVAFRGIYRKEQWRGPLKTGLYVVDD